MKNFKYFGFTLLLTLGLSHPVFAESTLSDKPEACPSLNAILSLGVNDAGTSMIGWIASNINRYDTTDTWFFGIPVPANDKEDAIKKGNENIQKLSSVEGPLINTDGTWLCLYTSSDPNILGLALTPLTSSHSLSHFAKFKR